MTTPNQPPIDGAYVIGSRFGSDQTEAGIRSRLKAPLNGFANAQSGFGALFAEIAQWIANFNMVIDEQITQAGEITDDLTNLENRVELLEGGAVTVRTYFYNELWTKPPGLIRLGVAVEGGGHAGRTGSTISAHEGGTGGLSGGYRFQWFELAAIENDLAATEPVVIGGGGSIPSQLGGVSKFGEHVVSVPGIGAVLSVEGAVVSNSATARGGNGGNGTDGSGTFPNPLGGEAGGSSAFAAGGAGGSTAGTRAGGNGQDAVISPVARGNGGGGGGGGGAQLAGSVGGKGGDGGFPAGPGGGGGGRGHGVGSADGPGGLAADGRVTLIEYTRLEE